MVERSGTRSVPPPRGRCHACRAWDCSGTEDRSRSNGDPNTLPRVIISCARGLPSTPCIPQRRRRSGRAHCLIRRREEAANTEIHCRGRGPAGVDGAHQPCRGRRPAVLRERSALDRCQRALRAGIRGRGSGPRVSQRVRGLAPRRLRARGDQLRADRFLGPDGRWRGENAVFAELFTVGRRPARTVAQAAALPYGAKVKIVAIAAKEAPTPD